MRTIDGVESWARDDAHDTRDGKTWNSWCESFVFRAGGFTGSFESALLAGNASGPLDTDWRTAQRGELHYWSGVGGNGHVAFELGGGLLLMASASVTDRWGVDMGTIPFRLYDLKGIPYRGHTFRHGSQRLAAAGPAGLGSTPVPVSEPNRLSQEAEMRIFRIIMEGGFNGTLWALGPNIMANLANVDDAKAAALRWNPDKSIIDVSDYEFNREMQILMLPGNLKSDLLVGGAWSRENDILVEVQKRPVDLGSLKLSDADMARIAASIKPVDLDALVARIDQADDDEQQAILAAIAATPAANLAALGLKRAS